MLPRIAVGWVAQQLWHSLPMPYKLCKVCRSGSETKELYTRCRFSFSSLSRLALLQLGWDIMRGTPCPSATTRAGLVKSVSNEWHLTREVETVFRLSLSLSFLEFQRSRYRRKQFFALQVTLLTDFNQTYLVGSECAMHGSCGLSFTSLQ
jgi:hypothetical protein